VQPAATVEPDLDRRAERYAARHTLWSESTLRRVRNCGRAPRSNAEGVGVRVTEVEGRRVSGYSRLQHCGSVWACPVCQSVIASRRQQEIAAALTEWQQRGGRVVLGTFTMRHREGQSLRSLWRALGKAWHGVTSGRGWAEDSLGHGQVLVDDDGGLRGSIPRIRVVEVTHGPNGWHVHVHALFLLPGTATDATVAALETRLYGRWVAGLGKHGLDATRRRGADLRLLQGDCADALGDYFVKGRYSAADSASFEAARGDLKRPADGHRSPFGILASLVETGDADDLDLWREWETVSRGRRAIEWSRGLRADLLGSDLEVSDEDLADGEDLGDEDLVLIDADTFREITRARADLSLLRAFERSEVEGRRHLALFQVVAGQEDIERRRRRRRSR
jgi:hypothetical protein